MACTSARGEERLQSLDSAQDADQALLPLFLSLSFFLSPSLCLSISCEFVARCDCNCMCRYESSYILHSTFCAPHFIFLSSFSYTAWSENCNLHCFFFTLLHSRGKNVNWKCSYAISICLACSAAKIAEQFCVFGPEPPLFSWRTVVHTFVRIHNIVVSCFWLQSFALRARKSIWHFMRNVCEGTKRKRVANCMKNSTSCKHTHTH